MIKTILNEHQAKFYIFVYEDIIYPTVVARIEERIWLVMFDVNGILETAFPPDNPERYLSNSACAYLGLLKDWETQ